MARNPDTTVDGRPFDAQTISAVWNKGIPVPGAPAAIVCTDQGGNVIARSTHGDTKSQYGWEVDHIKPVAQGGTDDLANLQPLQWALNRQKGDQYPWNWP